MKFLYDHRGSVSIFLIAIMVPMLTFSFMILDFAKIELASVSARNNTDMAASSSLTYYDKALADAYGLLASSANAEELTENVADYYIATMASSGINVEYPNDIYAAISNLINNANGNAGENDNMLNLVPDDSNFDKGFEIEPVTASAISNPVVMERQIVEYMKFRAPLNFAAGFMEKLDFLKDMGNQTKATSDRMTYEEKLSNLQNASDVCYHLIDSYFNNLEVSNDGFPFGKEVKFKGDNVHAISGKLSGDNDNVKVLNDINKSRENVILHAQLLSPLSDVIENGGTLYKKNITAKKLNVDSFNTLVTEISKLDFYDDIKTIFENKPDFSSITGDDISTDANIDKFYKIMNGYGSIGGVSLMYTPQNDDSTSDSTLTDSTYNSIAEYYYAFMQYYYGIEEYGLNHLTEEDQNRISSEYTEIYDYFHYLFGDALVYDEYGSPSGQEHTPGNFDDFVKNYYNNGIRELEKYNERFNDYSRTLAAQYVTAYTLSGDSGYDPLQELFDEANDAKTAADDWQDSINGVQTESMKANMQNDYNIEGKVIADLTQEAINSMKQTFRAQYSLYHRLYEQLKKYDDFNTTFSLYNLQSLTDFNLSGPDFSQNNPKYSENDFNTLISNWSNTQNSSQSFSSLLSSLSFSQENEELIPINGLKNDIESGELNGAVMKYLEQISRKNIIEDKPEKSELGKKDGEQAKKAQEEKKKEKEQEQQAQTDRMQRETEANPDKDNMSAVANTPTFGQYIKTVKPDYQLSGVGGNGNNNGEGSGQKNMENFSGKDLTELTYSTDTPGGGTEYNLSQITRLLDSVGSLMGDLATAARDDYYVAEYITGMFSCMTTNMQDGNDITDKEKTEKKLTGGEYTGNQHYRAELEYVIYGLDTEFKNKTASVGSISAIRFALNLIYSYTDIEITSFTSSTAALLTAWFPFAMPVVQTVLHVILSATETAYDMLELSNGNSVPLYKSTKTWICKGTNMVGLVIKKASKEIIKGLTDQLDSYLQGKIDEASDDFKKMKDNLVNEQKQFINDAVTEQILTPMNQFFNAMITRSDEMFDSSTKNLKSGAKEMYDGIIAQTLNGIKSLKTDNPDAGTSPVMNIVCDKAYGYISDNRGDIFNMIQDAVSNAIGNLTGIVSPTETIKKAQEEMTELVEEIVKKVNGFIDECNDKITGFVDEAVGEVKEEVSKGVKYAGDKAYQVINSKITSNLTGTRNVTISSGGSGGSASFISKALNMTYKDYLYIFLCIGLMGGKTDELNRSAQLMQCELRKNDPNYDMNKCATMFTATSNSKIKTSVIGHLADSNGISIDNFVDGYYAIEIKTFAGY